MMDNFQKELSSSCFDAYQEVDGISKIFETFRCRNMSRLSAQEHDLFQDLIEKFDEIQAIFHRIYVFAKHTEEV